MLVRPRAWTSGVRPPVPGEGRGRRDRGHECVRSRIRLVVSRTIWTRGSLATRSFGQPDERQRANWARTPQVGAVASDEGVTASLLLSRTHHDPGVQPGVVFVRGRN